MKCPVDPVSAIAITGGGAEPRGGFAMILCVITLLQSRDGPDLSKAEADIAETLNEWGRNCLEQHSFELSVCLVVDVMVDDGGCVELVVFCDQGLCCSWGGCGSWVSWNCKGNCCESEVVSIGCHQC